MPVDELRLDDLTWEDLVLAARSRIPAASQGQWTLHAPVDPGMTLLELFAAQLEERLYWLDQPCDARARAILKLLGVQPRSAIAAATVVALYSEDPVSTPIPRQTLITPEAPATSAPFSRRGAKPDVTFTTRHATLCLPVEIETGPFGVRWTRECVELVVGGQNRTLDLHNGKAPRLWLDDNGALDVDIILRLRAPLPAVDGLLSLLLDLETSEDVLPQWLPGATAPRADADVSWSYGSDEHGFRPFDLKAIKDGTRALRRSGVVCLPIRKDMQWLPVDGHRYQIRMNIRAAHFVAPPRLKQIVPNAAIASHRRRLESDEAGGAKLAAFLKDWNQVQTPNPIWQLPVAPDSVLPDTVGLWLQRNPEHPFESWRRVNDLVFSAAGDRVFSIDRAMSQLRFGDGYHGRLPVGTDLHARLTFHIGGGSSGNLSAGRVWDTDQTSLHAVNVVPAEGGADPEPLSDAAKRTAHEWRQPGRTVTAADFEYLAQHVPGAAIGRARAAIGHHPTYPCTSVEGAITVFVIPDVPEPPRQDWLARPDAWSALIPDRQTLALLRAQLDKARLVTQEVFIAAPIYQEVAVTLWVGVIPADADRVRANVTLAMYRFFHPLWGGTDGAGWPFGEDIYPSAVMKCAQEALGAGLVVTRVLISQPDGPATQCEPLAIGPLTLPNLKRVQLRFKPMPTTEGGLT